MTYIYNESFVASIERNQLVLTSSLLTVLYLTHILVPQVRGYTNKFISLQYPVNGSNDGLYVMGIDDVYYIINWAINLTLLRSLVMQSCLKLAGTRFVRIKSRNSRVRFAEQSWAFVYATVSFSVGVYLYIYSAYFNDLDQVYVGWPHRQLTPTFKMYYLISISFWIQQMFVLNVEKRRKDHFAMFTHHIITVLLMTLSYYHHFVRVGHLILTLMDSVDVFLAGAKLLKYANYSRVCDVMFIIFLISWVIARHGLYNVLFYHCWTSAGKLMDPALQCAPGVMQESCWSYDMLNIFLALLGGLQILTIIWMVMICKVAYRVISGTGAEDVRSDEDSDLEETVVLVETDEKEEDEIIEVEDEVKETESE